MPKFLVVLTSSKYLNGFEEDSDEAPEWFHLELGTPDEGPVVEQFHNLFQDPTERGIIKSRPVTPAESAVLKRLAGWHDIKPSTQSEIEELLSRVRFVDAVAIYDVGQGAATALLSNGYPALYFDLGGSVIGNWRSFPQAVAAILYDRRSTGASFALGLGPLVLSDTG